MGYRLTRIYTRTGDDGSTGLADGSRVGKDSPRIEAIGAVDELNCVLGVLLSESLPQDIRACLTGAQHDLFDVGGELSVPGHVVMKDEHVARLEKQLDRWNADLPPLKDFILPGGTRPAALAHAARAACRKAERTLVALSREASVPPAVLKYVNRLSDLLFVVARTLNRAAGQPDVLWKQDRENS
jgi:cob(I)alamin adenosyltransferase